MNTSEQQWSADPLIWGNGGRTLEIFLEPTCPFSARAFGKLDDLLKLSGPENLNIQIWLQSQPWHLFSGIICRAILAASTSHGGKEAARRVMVAIFAQREAFEFDDHRSGPNLNTTPNALIARMEKASGVALAQDFQISGLERELKRHTRYARQNGIHESPTFIVGGLINSSMSSGDSIEDWHSKIFNL
ncbi:MAG: DsbA family protein [Rhizobiaceae bacterium]